MVLMDDNNCSSVELILGLHAALILMNFHQFVSIFV